MTAAITISRQRLEELRRRRYRQMPALRLQDERQAVEFINDVGMSLLFSSRSIELPTLWGAICGEDRPIPSHHDDYELGLAWVWKDSIPERRQALYGKFLKNTPVFISLDLAAHFYALSDNYGELDDYLEAYRDGKMSEEARRIYETLLENGALPTSELRRAAGISSKGAARLFDRAIAELQMGFRIVKVGTSDANRWGYCYVYDLFLRQFPEPVAAARHIRQDDAAEAILQRYLQTVCAARPADVGRLFGWSAWRLERTIGRLAERGAILVDARVEGTRGEFLAANCPSWG